jgi:hypothetical protein
VLVQPQSCERLQVWGWDHAEHLPSPVQDADRRQRSVAAGGAAPLPDRKSEAAAKAADKVRNMQICLFSRARYPTTDTPATHRQGVQVRD